MKKLSEKVEAFSEVIKTLAGKGSDIVLGFEDLTFDILGGKQEKPRLSIKLSGNVRLSVELVKEKK